MQKTAGNPKGFKITSLLRPHLKLLLIGFLAVAGEGIANLLEPWPLKIVLDNVLRSKPTQGWLHTWILVHVRNNQLSVMKFAALAVLVIAHRSAPAAPMSKNMSPPAPASG